MDALEFLKERKRMCNSYKNCNGCLLERGSCGFSTSMSNEECERIITAVEKWSKEHPRKTKQSVFLEQWPNAELDHECTITIDPCDLDTTMRKECCNIDCETCRRKYWRQKVE